MLHYHTERQGGQLDPALRQAAGLLPPVHAHGRLLPMPNNAAHGQASFDLCPTNPTPHWIRERLGRLRPFRCSLCFKGQAVLPLSHSGGVISTNWAALGDMEYQQGN